MALGKSVRVRKARAFGSTLFFVTCDSCQSWVKSGVGQHVWEDRRQALLNANRHLQVIHKDFST